MAIPTEDGVEVVDRWECCLAAEVTGTEEFVKALGVSSGSLPTGLFRSTSAILEAGAEEA